MALAPITLTVDVERLRKLAELRHVSESTAAQDAINEALFAEEVVDALQALHDAGYGQDASDGPLASGEDI